MWKASNSIRLNRKKVNIHQKNTKRARGKIDQINKDKVRGGKEEGKILRTPSKLWGKC